ncbi:hypothetical protein LOTGIDRAFT_107196 [Lottia gigantea]|uniref:Uncharacterized protein n=1 Tax=Lottia gigantea TaxID=225164 RepID=V3Z8D6_LOTGI|nr:hypothetical protein LOTGIDRAFT_107196 [Lottia gigantea]ESO87148.1 hypothetical protein LOTGIDRAFT_107196 [Lottia gigantea]
MKKDDVYFKIIPSLCSISYELFSCNIMNPGIYTSLFQHRDVVIANCFWFEAHIGIGLYLYGSKHLQKASTVHRVEYAVFGSFLFNFGSVLFWATCKSLMPKDSALRTLFGLGSGLALLYIGKEYVDHIDRNMAK